MNIRPRLFIFIPFALLIFFARVAYAADVLDEARALLEGGNAKQAYDLLSPLEDERAGDVDFDFLFGLSALESGRPGIAVFAFERVLAVRPDHMRARAELARAYFEMRDDATAKREFENVKRMGPPEQVARTIERYLQAIDVRFEALKATQWHAYVQVGAGGDTNVNSATASSQIALPAFGNLVFALSPNAQERSDGFVEGEAGLTIGHRIADTLLAFGNAKINERINQSEREFDTGVIDAIAGLRHSTGRNAYTAALLVQRFEVGNDLFRTIVGGTVDWRHVLDSRNQITVFAQLAELSYHPDAQSLRDVTQLRGGVAWAHAFSGRNAPTMFLSVYVGEDDEEDSAFPYIGRTFFGARVGGEYPIRDNANLFASLSAEYSDYGGAEPLFLKSRDDDYYEFTFGLRYRMGGSWTLSPQIRYSQSESTIPIYEFDRTILLATLRYDIR